MKELSGKVAMITGAAGGIGKALARDALGRGMKVVLADFQAEALAATAAELGALGEVLAVPADVSKPEQVEAIAEQTWARFGACHLVINNAGVAVGKRTWELTTLDWQWTLGVNLWGVVYGINSFVPRMLRDGHEGHVVNVASVAGLMSPAGMAAYNVSKHSVVTLTETLYHDLREEKTPLSCSVLCPAWVNTGIAHSYKNRPADLRNTDRQFSEYEKQLGAGIAALTERGKISAEAVAALTLNAVVDDHFYILPHKKVKIEIEQRMRAVLDEQQPINAMPH